MSTNGLNKYYKCFHRPSAPDGTQTGAMTDVSYIVSGLEFDAGMSSFSTLKLDLVYGRVSMLSDCITINAWKDSGLHSPVTIRRNDILEVVEGIRGEDEFDRVLFRGLVSDFATSKSATSYTACIFAESTLAELECLSTIDLLSTHRSNYTGSTLLDWDNKETVEKSVQDKIPSVYKLKDSRGGAYSLWYGKGGSAQIAVYTTFRTAGIASIRPWYLVREVLSACLVVYIDNYIHLNTKILKTLTPLQEIAINGARDSVLQKLSLIEDGCQWLAIDYEIEYKELITQLIQTFLRLSGNSSSIWELLNSTMTSFFAVYCPYILTDVYGKGKDAGFYAGSFVPINPYKPISADIADKDIVSTAPILTDHNGLVRSVSFTHVDDLPYNVAKGSRELTSKLDRISVLYPDRAMWVLTNPGDFGVSYSRPKLGGNKEVSLPPWIDASWAVLKEKATAAPVMALRDGDGPDKLSDQSSTQLQATAAALNSSAAKYLAETWSFEGRRVVKANLELVTSFPALRPGNSIRCTIDSNVFTGMVSHVKLIWSQGSAHKVLVSLSHVTPIKDPYYRALSTGMYCPARDVLEVPTDSFSS